MTEEPLLVLLLVAALVQAFLAAPEKTDRFVLVWYCGLIGSLAALAALDVVPTAAGAS